jgi:acid phosphatase (class A)
VVKLKKILLDKMVYAKSIPNKHQKHIDNIGGVFLDFDIKNFMTMPPPSNSSTRTLWEIRSLERIANDVDVIKADKTREYFRERLETLGLEYPKDDINKIIDDSRGIIHILKYYYNRPRPKQIAKAYGLKFHEEPLKSTHTPAYPSGHSTQGRLISRYLSDLYPDHHKEIMKIGDEVSKSRMIAKVHYESDSEIGQALGDALYKHYKHSLV